MLETEKMLNLVNDWGIKCNDMVVLERRTPPEEQSLRHRCRRRTPWSYLPTSQCESLISTLYQITPTSIEKVPMWRDVAKGTTREAPEWSHYDPELPKCSLQDRQTEPGSLILVLFNFCRRDKMMMRSSGRESWQGVSGLFILTKTTSFTALM